MSSRNRVMREVRAGVVGLQRCLCLVLGLVFLWQSSAFASDEGRLTVEGTGVVLATPDIARVRAGVTSQAATAAAALQENSDAARAVLSALVDLDVAPEDVRTNNVSLFPEFERLDRQQDRPPRIVGYRASNSVTVTVRDLDALGVLLDALVQAGATDLGSIEFDSTKVEELKEDALASAMARAATKAARLSAAAGVELGDLISVTEQVGTVPGPFPGAVRALAAEAAVPIAPGQQRVEATVLATYAVGDE